MLALFNNPFCNGDTVHDPNGLLVTNQGAVTFSIVIAAGSGQLARGTVLGLVAASGKFVPCDKSATDGSANPAGVLVYGVDATTNDAQASAFVAGHFNGEALVLGPGWTLREVADAMSRRHLMVRLAAARGTEFDCS